MDVRSFLLDQGKKRQVVREVAFPRGLGRRQTRWAVSTQRGRGLNTHLRPRDDNLPVDKGEDHHLWHDHAVDEAREDFRLVLRQAARGGCGGELGGRGKRQIWRRAGGVQEPTVLRRGAGRTWQKLACAIASPSRRIENFRSHVPTMFWMVKS